MFRSKQEGFDKYSELNEITTHYYGELTSPTTCTLAIITQCYDLLQHITSPPARSIAPSVPAKRIKG